MKIKRVQSRKDSHFTRFSRVLAAQFRRIRRTRSSRARVIELIVFASLLPLCGVWLVPADPTGQSSGFPWIIVGPVLFSARYGSGWGVACAVLCALFLQLPMAAYEGLSATHLFLSMGMVVLCLIVGDASAAWRTRSGRAEAENHYLRHRLKQFSADYHVLKVSHGLLEEHMAGQRLSLREALQRLKPVLSASRDGLQAGSELMAVFSQFCSIQVAGLYAMSGEKTVSSQPVAIHGDMFDLPLFDPVLRTALTTREVASIKLESLAESHHEHSLLAAVPLVDTEGKLHGVLAIKDMHFMAFQQQNLNLLALLGQYVGNMLTRSQGAAQSRAAWFQAEVDMVLRFARSHGTDSALLSLKFTDHNQAPTVAHFLSESLRSLDASWLLDSEEGVPVLCLLLPLMSEAQSEAFVSRIHQLVKDKFHLTFNDLVADIRVKQVNAGDSRASCLTFLVAHTGTQSLIKALKAEAVAGAYSGAA